uniref:site-specific DNA-methyltransferase (cytosine-N(4)-specific) n=1 Tax=Candidatus Kentrum sp. FM TaxID=2126340 RepID=A0A450T1C6_9GAMM|nr:MAG: site-specific DNA-methyltransferase (adenine-specific) [Candidatus Kentron sp. FM]VFJ67577.1 MAG: site-specific DNA-methyltransferase (adenine-specific) [Candidatus Kentron sp. FM]VFK12216.1 MAG: site-specific DNA-methyltransferase (adenine-specific) [Candidatus Kentron sp. FM]
MKRTTSFSTESSIREVRILTGNCLEVLPLLEPESIQCCVTSPPYWGLRDYDRASQVGAEESPEQYVENLVSIFREVRRVLCKEGEGTL